MYKEEAQKYNFTSQETAKAKRFVTRYDWYMISFIERKLYDKALI